jgi:DNA-binding CsgD family transcriptional regulator
MMARIQTERASLQTPGEVQDLVRLLMHQAARGAEAGSMLCASDIESDTVLLDVEVDGVRCLLVRSPQSTVRGQEMLSPREQEIARMVARGYPNKTIAGVLAISSWTVGTYLRRIFAKLGVSTRAAMVARLMEEEQAAHMLK